MRSFFCLFLLSFAIAATAQTPKVSNVTAHLEGKEIIIEYDLSGPSSQSPKFTYRTGQKPKSGLELEGHKGHEFIPISLDGKKLSDAGHHRVAYRVLDDQRKDVWRANQCEFGVGVYNENKLLDKLFPVGGIMLGDNIDKHNTAPNSYNNARYCHISEGTFSTADFKDAKYLTEFSTSNYDRLPAHWEAMGFRRQFTPAQLIDFLKDLGFHINEIRKYDGDYKIEGVCNDLKLRVSEERRYENGKKAAPLADDNEPRKWSYRLILDPVNYYSNDKYDFVMSAPADYKVYENPNFADYQSVNLKTAEDDFSFYFISKDGKHYGVADTHMNIIIEPENYRDIRYSNGFFIAERYDNNLKQTVYSLLDPSGNVIIQDNPGDMRVLGPNAPLVVSKSGKVAALFSRDGKQLTEFKYDFPRNCLSEEEGLIAFTIGGKNLGFMDFEGRTVLNTKYYHLQQNFYNGYAVGTLDKDGKIPVIFNRQGVSKLPDGLLNNTKKDWSASISTKGMPKDVIAVYQERWQKTKDGMIEKLEIIDEDHFLYNLATGASWRLRPAGSVKTPFDPKLAFGHTFKQAGNYIVCYAKKKPDGVSRTRIVAVIGTDMKPLLPYNLFYMNDTKVIANRYLPYYYITNSEKVKGTFDLKTGLKINNDCVKEVGENALLVPKENGRFMLCNLDLEPIAPFEVSSASDYTGNGFYKVVVPAMELLRDKNGEYHYLPEHAPEPMRASLEPDSVKGYSDIFVNSDGVVYGSIDDAYALRNRIADYVAPSTHHKPISAVDSKLQGLARQGDPGANYGVYWQTSIPSYLDRAVELEYPAAIGHKGYLLLATSDSVQGREMLRQAAEAGNKDALAFDALEMSKKGNHADAYQRFMALGNHHDARHEAGMSALAMAYELYAQGGKDSGYDLWVERAADCHLPLAEKWCATIAKERGDSKRCAELYARAADRKDLDAAYAAALEFEALGDYPSFEKYMQIAAKAKLADADAILGKYYLNGRPGVDADKVKAYPWLNQAHMRGDESMAPILKDIALPLATDAMSERKYKLAASYIRKYISIDSINPEAYEVLGLACYGAGDYASAAEAFRHQLKLQPKNIECIDNIERATSKYNAEQAALQRKAKIEEYRKAANKAISGGNYQDAITNCESAYALNSSLSWPYALIGKAYYFMRDYNTSISYCQRALALNPDDSDAKSYLQFSNDQLQAQHNAQAAAQQQIDKWQAIANLCSSTQQLCNAISNATSRSTRQAPAQRRAATTAPASSTRTPAASTSSSTRTTPKQSYTATDVQHRKTNQYVYDQYASRIIAMKSRTYPYSDGFTLSELKDCQDNMRRIRTEWNAKHPDLPIYGSDLETWSGR